MTDAFDADVVIRAAKPEGRLQRRALASSRDRIGSVVLLPEALSWALRRGATNEARRLNELFATFDLKPVDEEIADASVTIGAKYGLRAADAIHLATAIVWGAERFVTNNTKDFGPHITEIDVVVPSA